jgi:DNA-binding response OmpR family regulator
MNAWRVRQMKTARPLSASVQFNPFTRTLDDASRGVSQQLSAREAAFLLAILDAGSKGLTRERAITDVWGYHRDVDSHAVETAAYRLRQKLAPLFGDAEVLASAGGTYIWKG